MKGIKKTFICEADQSRSELRKNYLQTLIFLFPMRGEEKKPMLHVVFVLIKLMRTECQYICGPIIHNLEPFSLIFILPNSPTA